MLFCIYRLICWQISRNYNRKKINDKPNWYFIPIKKMSIMIQIHIRQQKSQKFNNWIILMNEKRKIYF
mgnify:CR=1 FL=1